MLFTPWPRVMWFTVHSVYEHDTPTKNRRMYVRQICVCVNARHAYARSSRRCVRAELDLLVLAAHSKREREHKKHTRSHRTTTYTSSLHFENVSLLMLMSLATRDNARRRRRNRRRRRRHTTLTHIIYLMGNIFAFATFGVTMTMATRLAAATPHHSKCVCVGRSFGWFLWCW